MRSPGDEVSYFDECCGVCAGGVCLCPARTESATRAIPAGADDISIDGATARFAFADDAAAQQVVLKMLIDAGLPVCAFAPARGRLQDLYLARLAAAEDAPC